jgi:arylsulfatase A-like enzyme
MTDHAIQFMETSVAAGKKFFLYFPSFLIHAPLEAKPEALARFADKPPTSKNDWPPLAALTFSLDESVGRIMARMEELGIAEDTLVIFTSDHGNRYNLPLRGGKYSLYEGGIRVPFIFRWKGVIGSGTTSDEPIINVDLYPTLLELAGAAAPADYPLDGISIAPVLRQPERHLSRDKLFWHTGKVVLFEPEIPSDSVRVGDFKLIEHYEADTTRVELFDLASDPGESQDLSAANPDKVRELQHELAAWRASELRPPTPAGAGP